MWGEIRKVDTYTVQKRACISNQFGKEGKEGGKFKLIYELVLLFELWVSRKYKNNKFILAIKCVA